MPILFSVSVPFVDRSTLNPCLFVPQIPIQGFSQELRSVSPQAKFSTTLASRAVKNAVLQQFSLQPPPQPIASLKFSVVKESEFQL